MAMVWMMQMAIHQIVDMVAVRHCFMTTSGAVDVIGGVGSAGMIGSAGVGVGLADCQDMLVDVAFMRGVKVTVMDVVDVPLVLDCGMSASGPVDVAMIFVNDVTHCLGFLSYLPGIRWRAPAR